MVLTFNQGEVNILNEICDIQIASYKLILEQNLLEDDKELISQYQVSLDDAYREAKWRISEYQNVIKDPKYMGIMDESELSTMRHILFRIEEDYVNLQYESIRALWEKFFKIEEFRNQRISLSLTLNKIVKDENRKTSKEGR